MSYYEKHVFFCTNRRENGEKCCQQADAESMRVYAKTYLKSLNLHGKHKIRISSAGCLGRCKSGPIVLIYPSGNWYTYNNLSDVEKIIDEVVLKNNEIPELSLDSNG